MAQPTFAQLRSLRGGSAGVVSETIQERLITLLSILASGQNPDASAYTPGIATSPPATVSNNASAFWNNVAVGVGGTSAAASLYALRNWLIIGHASAATTVTVQVSIDTATWYTSPVNAVLSGAGDFVLDCRPLFGSTFVRLLSSAAATITAGYMGNY